MTAKASAGCSVELRWTSTLVPVTLPTSRPAAGHSDGPMLPIVGMRARLVASTHTGGAQLTLLQTTQGPIKTMRW